MSMKLSPIALAAALVLAGLATTVAAQGAPTPAARRAAATDAAVQAAVARTLNASQVSPTVADAGMAKAAHTLKRSGRDSIPGVKSGMQTQQRLYDKRRKVCHVRHHRRVCQWR